MSRGLSLFAQIFAVASLSHLILNAQITRPPRLDKTSELQENALRSLLDGNSVILRRSMEIKGDSMEITEQFFDVKVGQWMVLNGQRVTDAGRLAEVPPLTRKEIISGFAWDGKYLFEFHGTHNRWSIFSDDVAVGQKRLEQIIPGLFATSNPFIRHYLANLKANLGTDAAESRSREISGETVTRLKIPWAKDPNYELLITLAPGGLVLSETVVASDGKIQYASKIYTLAEHDFNVGADAISQSLPPIRREVFAADLVKGESLLGFSYERSDEGLRVTRVLVLSDAFKRGLRPGDAIIAINGLKVKQMPAQRLRELTQQKEIELLIKTYGDASERKVRIQRTPRSNLMDESGDFPVDSLFEENRH